MMIAIGYDRVSTKRQAKAGIMLEARSKSIPAYCEMKGWKMIRYYRDRGISGREGKLRPGFDKAMKAACKPGRVLVVDSLSRFVRSTIDADRALRRLHDAGADLVIVNLGVDTTTASGKLIFKMIAAVAEFESNQIGERVRAANRHTTEKMGYRTQGKQPVGYKIVNGRRVPCEREIQLVARVRELASRLGCLEAARALEAAGEPTINQLRKQADASGWTARKVRHLLVKAGTPAGGGTARLMVAPLPAPVA